MYFCVLDTYILYSNTTAVVSTITLSYPWAPQMSTPVKRKSVMKPSSDGSLVGNSGVLAIRTSWYEL